MEILYCIYELGNFEFMGSLTECRQYIAANEFNGSHFTILEV